MDAKSNKKICVNAEDFFDLVGLYEDFKYVLSDMPTSLGDYFEYDVWDMIEDVQLMTDEARKQKRLAADNSFDIKKTVTVLAECIGGIDQNEWTHFKVYLDETIKKNAHIISFFGNSEPLSVRQNVCWVINPMNFINLKNDIEKISKSFNQFSISITVGEAEILEWKTT